MYVNPFLAGVLTLLLIELATIITYSVWKGKKK